ncbi:MAG: polyprenol monophosphomannose synthase [Chthoniobacteraceae bacterium]
MKLFRPITLLILFLCVFCGILGFGWLHQGPSDQDLACFSKAIDYFRGVISVKGWPWWTPNFLGGHSLAPSMGSIFSYFSILLGVGIFGPFHGPKIIGLVFMVASGLSMFGFAKAFSRSDWIALVCAIFYVTCPQLSLLLAAGEQFTTAACFPYPPLILWTLMMIAETASWRNSILFAMALAGMTLTFAKLALLFLPVIAAFGAWLYITRKECRKNLWIGIRRSLLPLTLLGILPLLPSMRELRWMTMFSDDPFEGWQRSFSIKTSLSWFDRGGALMTGSPGYFLVEQGGFYLGAIAICAFAVFFLWKRNDSLKSEIGRKCRLFIGLSLFIHWLSFGPRSIFSGHMEFLHVAQGVQNWVLPLFWFALVAQIWIIARLWPECRGRSFWITVGVAVYLFVPGFQIIARIPGFNQIRAPWSYWQVAGSFCLSMAAGLAVASFLNHASASRLSRYFRSRSAQIGIAALVLALGLADLSVYHARFFQGSLPGGTFKDFDDAETFLMRAHRPGRVYAISGRYFYLMTPFLSWRVLNSESFNSFYMERWSRAAMDNGQTSPELLKTYMNVNGITYVLIDKKDENVPAVLQKDFRDAFPTAHENEHFLILENTDSLAPAFTAREFIVMLPESYGRSGEMLSYGQFNFLSVEMPLNASNDFAGVVDEKGGIQIKPEYKKKGGTPFQRVAMGPSEEHEFQKSFQDIEMPPIGQQSGWLVICESYHPDWKAYAGNREIPVRRAMGSLLAVPLPEKPAPIHLKFEPPAWYSASADISLLSWLGCCLLILTGSLAPDKWRQAWYGIEMQGNEPLHGIMTTPISKKTVEKSIVVIPTYNEANNLPELFGRVFQLPSNIDVLIVDDASPDGTAQIVKQHAEFGRRLFLMERSGKLGLATAYKQGFQWALQRNYDACMEMDADLSHDPADIPKLLEALNNGADIAIGSRYLNGIRVLNWPQNRLQLSLFAGLYTRTLAGLPLSDPTSGFKAIRREVLEAFDWSRFIASGYGFQIEIHFYAWRNGFCLREVPIIFTERHEGRSKMSWRISAEAALRVLRLVPARLIPFKAGGVSKSKPQG